MSVISVPAFSCPICSQLFLEESFAEKCLELCKKEQKEKEELKEKKDNFEKIANQLRLKIGSKSEISNAIVEFAKSLDIDIVITETIDRAHFTNRLNSNALSFSLGGKFKAKKNGLWEKHLQSINYGTAGNFYFSDFIRYFCRGFDIGTGGECDGFRYGVYLILKYFPILNEKYTRLKEVDQAVKIASVEASAIRKEKLIQLECEYIGDVKLQYMIMELNEWQQKLDEVHKNKTELEKFIVERKKTIEAESILCNQMEHQAQNILCDINQEYQELKEAVGTVY